MSEVPKDVEALATALHWAAAAGGTFIELHCYCRRIATTDYSIDGEQDPNWSHRGEVYDPNEWGDTAERPTGCEKTAMTMKEKM